MMHVAKKSLTLWTLLGLMALAVPAFAQSDTGNITGVVEDPTGAVIPGATVSITNQGTNRSQTFKTDVTGVFRFVYLAPGMYSVKAEAKGFKTIVNRDIALTVGVTQRVDFKMEIGQETQTITVEAAAPLVNTEEGRLSTLVSGSEVANLPLNGRNIYQLMQLAPGAVNVRDVMIENGADTVVNGVRENFNGFWVDGIANKQLSGGFNIQPNQDIVQEFRVNTLNMSAEYGNSAGSVTTIVTKSGTNAFHGTAYEFFRNDALDANEFFRNKAGCDAASEPLCGAPLRPDGTGSLAKTPLRFNQFGITAGGPIRKDKTFFFGSYQGSRTKTFAAAIPISMESAQWRQAVQTALPNSTAALLYGDFTGPAGSPLNTVDEFVTDTYGGFDLLVCPSAFNGAFGPGSPADMAKAARYVNSFQQLFGVTAAEGTACGIPAGQTAAQIANRTIPFEVGTVALIGSQTVGNLFNADEYSARIDHNFSEGDRLYGRFYFAEQTDSFGPTNVTSLRGFSNPQIIRTPSLSLSWTHVFSPTIVNEARAGFSRNRNDIDVDAALGGVPYVAFDTGDVGFGSYNGYPQFFHETIFNYSDMLSITKGKHGLKMGVDVRRNLENSEFNVARPSLYFFDPIFFAADAVYEFAGGVDPGIISGQPAQLATNNRAWRNLELGAFIQDDWKVTPHLTLNLGLRYDLFRRHNEKFGRATQFILGSGSTITEAMINTNTAAGLPGCDTPEQIAQAQIAGVCGPGGFASAATLGESDRNNFGPRFGFAWDPRGNGKTALRGGFGVSFEGTLYNPLSNSRWNLPYYSFNISDSFLIGDVGNPIYGPHMVDGLGNVVFDPAETPTYGGAGTNPGQGVGAQAFGNLSGWDANDPNLAFLTAIVPNKNFRDPYVYNFFFGIQHELAPTLVLEVNYVGTAGHKLFRAQQINRARGGRLPEGSCITSQGEQICSLRSAVNPAGRANPNYGTMRMWENAVNSNYNALQIQLNRKMSRGFGFNMNYTWGHAIDGGSGWHNSATSANGGAGGDGYSSDVAHPELDRGHSTFDFRHRFSFSQVLEFPWMKNQEGVAGKIFGGWQFNSIWTFQSGAHWSTFDSRSSAAGGDFNLDGVNNDRPDALRGNSIVVTKDMWANGFFGGNAYGALVTAPCLGCNGNLGRNTLLGPSFFSNDMSLFKNIRVSERVTLQFRSEFFNTFNSTNFKMPNSSTGQNGATRANSGIFGTSNGTFEPRQIQLALKLIW